MQSPEGAEIAKRFLHMLNRLVEVGILPSKHYFLQMHNINLGNFSKIEREIEVRTIRVEWLTWIWKMGVNAEYLLSGEGPEFSKGIIEDGRVTDRAYRRIWREISGTKSGTAGTK